MQMEGSSVVYIHRPQSGVLDPQRSIKHSHGVFSFFFFLLINVVEITIN